MMQAGDVGMPMDLNVPVLLPSPLQAPVQPQPPPPLPATEDNLSNNTIPTGVPYMQPPYPWTTTSETYQTDGDDFKPQQGGAGEDFEDDEPPLNEDDDDDLDDVVEGYEELNTKNLVLAQFEKVKRAKNKWRCTLKDGIMHLNNRDILINGLTGVFDF